MSRRGGRQERHGGAQRGLVERPCSMRIDLGRGRGFAREAAQEASEGRQSPSDGARRASLTRERDPSFPAALGGGPGKASSGSRKCWASTEGPTQRGRPRRLGKAKASCNKAPCKDNHDRDRVHSNSLSAHRSHRTLLPRPACRPDSAGHQRRRIMRCQTREVKAYWYRTETPLRGLASTLQVRGKTGRCPRLEALDVNSG
jgi:hypothetical protein